MTQPQQPRSVTAVRLYWSSSHSGEPRVKGRGHTPTSQWGDQPRICRQSLSLHGAPSPDSGVIDIPIMLHLSFIMSYTSEGFTLGLFSLPRHLE